MTILQNTYSAFLDTSMDRYVRYSTELMHAVFRARLLALHGGDEHQAFRALIQYMRNATKTDHDNLYRNFLTNFNDATFDRLLDRLDFRLFSKLIMEHPGYGELGLLKDDVERQAIRMLQYVRNRLAYGDLNHDFARLALKDAAQTFSRYLSSLTILQIDQYYCGLEPLSADVESNTLLDATAQLPETERLAILLRYFNGLSQEQTSQILQLPREQISRLERRGSISIRKHPRTE